MNIKLSSIAATIFLVFAFGWLETICAQQPPPKETSCQQSAKEIFSKMETLYNLSPAPDKILVVGEVYAQQFLANEKSLSLTQALAKVGGFSRNAGRSVYLLRLVTDGEESTVLKIGFREIKKGGAKDLLLENGDVVFVPRRCANRKTAPFTYTPIRFPKALAAQD